MFDRRALIVMVAAAGMLTGCASAKRAQASPGLLRADAPVLSLGAGDSLGQRVYLNDLIIAARATNTEVAVTAVPESMPIDLGD
ncbi:hypothetical protein PHYC_02229 [Phycisphaerales bacterium]|nr:hypothetical protein PHYC_02229 [Phycisphaerales bacterium]